MNNSVGCAARYLLAHLQQDSRWHRVARLEHPHGCCCTQEMDAAHAAVCRWAAAASPSRLKKSRDPLVPCRNQGGRRRDKGAAGGQPRACTVASTWSMTPSMSFRLSVFMSRNSTPSAPSLVRAAISLSGMVRCSAGRLRAGARGRRQLANGARLRGVGALDLARGAGASARQTRGNSADGQCRHARHRHTPRCAATVEGALLRSKRAAAQQTTRRHARAHGRHGGRA
jgi:hypothetical protein